MWTKSLPPLILLRSIMGSCAAFAIVGLAVAAPSDAQPASVGLVAIDTDPSGNGPRAVGIIDECLSANAGQPVDIDIVIPSPGVPAGRGIAGYDFSLLYDPAIVWTESDWINDGQLRRENLLLDQATGSTLIAITDPTPNTFGSHRSLAVDFGPKGIEPSGASEVGPGVIDRVTLLPRSTGSSSLTLIDVVLVGDDSERITVEEIHPATIVVGAPCPEAGQSKDDPQPTPTGTPVHEAATPGPSSTPVAVGGTSSGPSALASAGGLPPRGGTPASSFVLFGLGVGLLAAGGAVVYLVRRDGRDTQIGRS